MNIPILMHDILTDDLTKKILRSPCRDAFNGQVISILYGPSGRWLLNAILNSIGLSRGDEIAILTTSNEIYVSTCVSVTAFNYARISRIVTPLTKVIILIHEFGYVANAVEQKVAQWKNEGKVIIEDCAHVVGLPLFNTVTGLLGDYSIFSLKKIIPCDCGGMLLTNRKIELPVLNEGQSFQVEKAIRFVEKFLSHYSYFNSERLRRHLLMKRELHNRVAMFEPSLRAVPYFSGFVTQSAQDIMQKIKGVEWGATLRKDLVYVPTNPLVPIENYEIICNQIQSAVEQPSLVG